MSSYSIEAKVWPMAFRTRGRDAGWDFVPSDPEWGSRARVLLLILFLSHLVYRGRKTRGTMTFTR